MRFDRSPALVEAQLLAFADLMAFGTGNPSVELYDGTQPAPPGSAPTGSVLLVTVELNKPIGVVSSGVLTVAVSPLALVMNGGGAQWARWRNGNGAWVGDSDVSNDAGTGFVRLTDTTLFAGGKTQILGGTIG